MHFVKVPCCLTFDSGFQIFCILAKSLNVTSKASDARHQIELVVSLAFYCLQHNSFQPSVTDMHFHNYNSLHNWDRCQYILSTYALTTSCKLEDKARISLSVKLCYKEKLAKFVWLEQPKSKDLTTFRI